MVLIQGTVKDGQTGDPLSFVRIEFFSSTDTVSTLTDFDGFFLIRYPKESLSLRTDHKGYRSYRSEIDLANGLVDLRIQLEPMERKP